MDRIAIRAKILPKDKVLANSSSFRDRNIMILEIDKKYYEAAKKWAMRSLPLLDDLIVTLGFQGREFSAQAFKLFWAIIQEIGTDMNDTSRENKQQLHDWALHEIMAFDVDGSPKTSLKELDKRELWDATQMLWLKLLEVNPEPWHIFPMLVETKESYGSGK